MIISNKHKFYLSLLMEIIKWPWEYSKNFLKLKFGNFTKSHVKNKIRVPVLKNKLSVCIHEWGGYEGKRIKKIKNIKEFECGLDYQLERFQKYDGECELDLTLTISDSHLLKQSIEGVKIMNVSNIGMDFSGYAAFYESIKSKDNKYVILTNSSVNKLQVNFIDDYIRFFKLNNSVGMLGISYNTKMYQSLIRNNFNPHLQSFFLLTTTEVLNEVVRFNETFPGKDIDYKLALIKYGEIKLSRIVMDLGYKLCCVLDNGQPFLFDKASFKDNGRNTWSSFFGDYRLNVDFPNAITSLKNKN